MNKSVDELANELKILLRARDFDISDSDSDTFLLKYEIKRAINEINNCRNFTPSDDSLYDTKYEHLILPLSISAFAKIGAEGQSSHSENGITRNYTSGGDYPTDVLDSIIPLIK
jgi:hypothetical protein